MSAFKIIRDLADQHANDLGFTSFIETFDHSSNEPVLQIVIGAHKNELYLHIYIHNEHRFVIGKSGSRVPTRTAEQALKIIAKKLKEVTYLMWSQQIFSQPFNLASS